MHHLSESLGMLMYVFYKLHDVNLTYFFGIDYRLEQFTKKLNSEPFFYFSSLSFMYLSWGNDITLDALTTFI